MHFLLHQHWCILYTNSGGNSAATRSSVSQHQNSNSAVSCGVPQGSILGPLLFLIFMNDLPLVTKDTCTDMFADDSTIHTNGRTIDELERKLNNDLTKIDTWCDENQMAINVDKTKAMLVTTHQKAWRLPKQELDIKLKGKTLENVACEKLLGVHLDNRLNWATHIHQVAVKISRNLALLRRIKGFLPIHARKLFYFTHIQPYFDYCSTIWGKGSGMGKLVKLQRRVMRVMSDLPYDADPMPAFKKHNITPIMDRIDFRTACIVHRALLNDLPPYICDMFQYTRASRDRNTRFANSQCVKLPKLKLEIARQGLRHNGAEVYNNLDCCIRNANSIQAFKTAYMSKYFSQF